MNPPQVYMCSPSWTLLPPPSPYHPSGSSQCTSPKHPVLCSFLFTFRATYSWGELLTKWTMTQLCTGAWPICPWNHSMLLLLCWFPHSTPLPLNRKAFSIHRFQSQMPSGSVSPLGTTERNLLARAESTAKTYFCCCYLSFIILFIYLFI